MLGTVAAQAQDYPNKPIKILVPYQPGGTTDITARLIGEEMRKALGQPVVVENKPGAFGILAIEEMAKSKPDGYTLMLGNVTTNGVTPVLHVKKMKIDYLKDVVTITRIGDVPSLVVGTQKNWAPKTFQEAMDWAKANPGKLRYGSTGPGNYAQIDSELIARKIGAEFVHVVAKNGAAEVLNDLISGDTQFALLNVATGATHVKAGNLKALAVAWPTRLPVLPDVPTLTELGMPGIGTIAWQAVFAPAGTPKEIVAKLHKTIVDSLNAPPLQEAYAKQNIQTTFHKSPDEAQAWMADEIKSWKTNLDILKLDLDK
jgi:tripartite-type tricarboxylate transporter receptor subunit TctC